MVVHRLVDMKGGMQVLLKDGYCASKACAMSAIRSDGCSSPIDSRIVELRIPIFRECRTERRSASCRLAGWQATRCRPNLPPA